MILSYSVLSRAPAASTKALILAALLVVDDRIYCGASDENCQTVFPTVCWIY